MTLFPQKGGNHRNAHGGIQTAEVVYLLDEGNVA